MKKISKSLLLVICLSFYQELLANEENEISKGNQGLEYESRKNLGKSSFEARVYEETSLIEQDNMMKDGGQFNYPEVIYEHFKAYNRMPSTITEKSIGKGVVNASYNFYAEYVAEQEKAKIEQAQKQAELKAEMEKPDIRALSGYCTLFNEATIERIAGYATLSCDFINYGRGQLTVALTPDFYSQALIASPLYINLNNQRIPVQAGVVTNGVRTSINVATVVNDYKIEKIVAASGIAMANVATKYAQEYLEERKDSREEETGGEIIAQNGVIVQQPSRTNRKEPVKSDYITGAIIELTSNIVNIVGNAYLDSLPYTFKIDKDTIMYSDLQIDFNAKGIRGIDFAPANMIQADEPRYNLNTNRFIDRSSAKQVPIAKPDNARAIQGGAMGMPKDGNNESRYMNTRDNERALRPTNSVPNSIPTQPYIYGNETVMQN